MTRRRSSWFKHRSPGRTSGAPNSKSISIVQSTSTNDQRPKGLALYLIARQRLRHHGRAGFEIAADEQRAQRPIHLHRRAAENRAADAEQVERIGCNRQRIDAIAQIPIDLNRADGTGLREDRAELIAAANREGLDAGVDALHGLA